MTFRLFSAADGVVVRKLWSMDPRVGLYYTDQWQVAEERINGQTTQQYVWSPVYVDAMVLRD